MWQYHSWDDAPWVTVEWEDIQDADDWDEEGDEIACTAQMQSTGYLIYADSKVVVLGRTFSVDDGTWHDKRAFPRGVVVSIRRATTWVDEEGSWNLDLPDQPRPESDMLIDRDDVPGL